MAEHEKPATFQTLIGQAMANPFPQAITPQQSVCKVCGAPAAIFGVTDFNHSCINPQPLSLSGIPIYYYRCAACGFIFTNSFDDFSTEDFLRHIYNEQYALIDPEFEIVRPTANSNIVGDLFKKSPNIRILDFGGGNGSTAAALRNLGFTNIEVYDPYVKVFAARPVGLFDLVLSFEVLEHSHRPLETIRDMFSFVKTPGLVFFSTLLRIPEVESAGMQWWYIGPRNGHVSIFSPGSIAHVSQLCGIQCVSANQNLHLAFFQVPEFASHVVGRR